VTLNAFDNGLLIAGFKDKLNYLCSIAANNKIIKQVPVTLTIGSTPSLMTDVSILSQTPERVTLLALLRRLVNSPLQANEGLPALVTIDGDVTVQLLSESKVLTAVPMRVDPASVVVFMAAANGSLFSVGVPVEEGGGQQVADLPVSI
jgi:hypothetical protein